ncbi:hypothetical protein VTJ04DRAFT_6339 [Mycothermus thermophilus]|uniref:uncharacterized protein n=1 Tax=Humicola insolens TaxID=85995 RepID=UPI0037425491
MCSLPSLLGSCLDTLLAVRFERRLDGGMKAWPDSDYQSVLRRGSIAGGSGGGRPGRLVNLPTYLIFPYLT